MERDRPIYRARVRVAPHIAADLAWYLGEGRYRAVLSSPPQPGVEGWVTVEWAFESLEEARAWAESDPYVEAGVYESVEVSPFIRVFPS